MNPLVLVNVWHTCPEGCPDLVPVGDSPVLLERQAAQALEALMGSLDGWRSIVPVSGWRSFQEQEAIYAGSLAENGPVFTQKYVALPGHSEHQTGLAIDLGLRAGALWLALGSVVKSGAVLIFGVVVPPVGEHIRALVDLLVLVVLVRVLEKSHRVEIVVVLHVFLNVCFVQLLFVAALWAVEHGDEFVPA